VPHSSSQEDEMECDSTSVDLRDYLGECYFKCSVLKPARLSVFRKMVLNPEVTNLRK
jgi:hypothetical protein